MMIGHHEVIGRGLDAEYGELWYRNADVDFWEKDPTLHPRP
jgi:hypothetical protein